MHGLGLVAGKQVVKPGAKTPDPDTATAINLGCIQKGLMMFVPVDIGGECIKIASTLTIAEEALYESILVFEETVDEVLGNG